MANIVPVDGEPIAVEGEVCCGAPENDRDIATRQECKDEWGGIIVGDIGNGAIFQPGYVCESNGEPPMADIVPAEGEPIAFEGEVCCGSGNVTSGSIDGPVPTPQACNTAADCPTIQCITAPCPEAVCNSGICEADPVSTSDKDTDVVDNEFESGTNVRFGSVANVAITVGTMVSMTFCGFFH